MYKICGVNQGQRRFVVSSSAVSNGHTAMWAVPMGGDVVVATRPYGQSVQSDETQSEAASLVLRVFWRRTLSDSNNLLTGPRFTMAIRQLNGTHRRCRLRSVDRVPVTHSTMAVVVEKVIIEDGQVVHFHISPLPRGEPARYPTSHC
ncbi:unnamed protein product [Haemonchus placei]|uniref:Bacteriophage protein n=1 Tax=Haemonchus placei TaxID=6290 RepID=A0A0N4WSB9_HAEPC|nr:unnamed protein product [Haemonchus placei]